MEKAKKTIVEMYKEIMEVPEVKANAEMVEFLKKRIELTEKKKGSTNSKKVEENKKFFAEIESVMRAIGKPATATEIFKGCGGELANYSPNKVSAMLKKMAEEEGTVEIDRTNKKVTLFSLKEV
jgi:hypothetical protein